MSRAASRSPFVVLLFWMIQFVIPRTTQQMDPISRVPRAAGAGAGALQCLCLHPPWAHWGHGSALPLDDAWGRWRGQELLSLLAGCADGAFYGIILGWDQQEALGLLNVPGTLTITQLLPHCWGLEPGLGQPIQGQPFWPLAQGWTSPSRLMGAVGIHIPLCPWVRAASPALGAAFGIPLASPHLLRRAPAEPAHKGQLHECHGSPCC